MTPDQENELFRSLGEITQGIKGLETQVKNHVEDDRKDFRGVYFRVNEVKDALEKDLSEVKNDVKTHSNKIAVFCAAGGFFVAIALAFAREIIAAMFKL